MITTMTTITDGYIQAMVKDDDDSQRGSPPKGNDGGWPRRYRKRTTDGHDPDGRRMTMIIVINHVATTAVTFLDEHGKGHHYASVVLFQWG